MRLTLKRKHDVLIASNRCGKNTATVCEVICKMTNDERDREFLFKLWDKLIGVCK